MVSARSDTGWIMGVAVVLVALAVALGMIVTAEDDDAVRGALIIAFVVPASLIIFQLATRGEVDGPQLFVVLSASLMLKLAAVAFRLWLIFDVYGGTADARGYHDAGVSLAEGIAAGSLPELSRYYGTDFVRLVTGIFYTFTGPTLIGAFVFWAWLGLLGMLCFYKAFTVAFPGGDRRLFRVLIMLYPSLLLWTSSLGKDALIFFSLGLATYGAALLTQRIDIKSGLMTVGGLAGVFFVRPPIAGIAAVALAVGWLLRPIRAGLMTPVVRLVGVLVVAILAVTVLRTSARLVGLDLSTEGVTASIEKRQVSTEQGGAAIQRALPTSPVAIAEGLATVFFRPFPWEAHNLFAMISAAEGVALMILLGMKRRSVLAAIAAARRDPLLLVILVYVLLFAITYLSVSNFAIIARQRVQLLPFIFMWLAYLPGRPKSRP